jgi:hypothetical protein
VLSSSSSLVAAVKVNMMDEGCSHTAAEENVDDDDVWGDGKYSVHVMFVQFVVYNE